MNKKILVVSIVMFSALIIHAQEKPLLKGMKISKSVKIKKNIYRIDANEKMDGGVIIIEGEDITVDFNHSVMKGSNSKKNPDEYSGVCIIIRNSRHITIKNLKASGYKVGILANDVESLTLENCDLSYNYRAHLNSTQEKEHISDWMSYHHNEKDEWLRYGAGIYLRNCGLAIIRDCKVTGGQNALMMTDCNDALIYNNDFSFNSGIGLGMYRCSRNKITFNRINFNVRGYSDGVYSRGQDSAGILVYEQSNENLFYKNSVTHGGDGFFLWAGQTTMDSGKGGCNDNVLLSNDFSYAPTNGIEVTFSRNKIMDNRIYECDHGIWGGYSYESDISNNKFRFNRIGIAIEHGQDNDIHHNIFYRDGEAIRLWARKEQPADWGYARNKDTRSRNYAIASNSFNQNSLVFNITLTDQLKIFGNTFAACGNIYKIDSTVTNLDTTENADLSDKFSKDSAIAPPFIEKPIDPFKGNGALAGRKNILITEWGPYDFRYPIIWNTNPTDTSGIMLFDIKGPKGKWVIKNVRGLDSLSIKKGDVPATLSAKKLKSQKTDISIELEYRGSSVVTQHGEIIAAGKPYLFSFRKFFQPIDWEVNWFGTDSVNNPIKTGYLFPPNVRLRPIKSEKVKALDYAWWGGIKADKNYPMFITVAEGAATVDKGLYELAVTWDDAIRVYVDEKLLIDEWNPSKYTFDESPHKTIGISLGGKHKFRVEHVELGGFATLSVKLKAVQ
jgi:parallel beta helix pectate lyase-like protein/PA14 domain-containing protein/copper-binding protein NosD